MSILRAGGAGDSDRATILPSSKSGNPPSTESPLPNEDTQAVASGRKSVLKAFVGRLNRAAVRACRRRYCAAQLRVVHLLVVNQIARWIDDRNGTASYSFWPL